MRLSENIDQWVKALSLLGAVVAFAWGVIQFVASQQAQEETRRIEATKPFLERQLRLYTEATQAAATLATSKNRQELDAATKSSGRSTGANWLWWRISVWKRRWSSLAAHLMPAVPGMHFKKLRLRSPMHAEILSRSHGVSSNGATRTKTLVSNT